MNRLVTDQRGYVLIAALLVLLLVGLLSGPVLSYMVSGLRAGHTFETGVAELYAADSGVTDALWRIKAGGLCLGNRALWDGVPYHIEVNDKNVEVTIDYEDGPYKITSVATSEDSSETRIVSYVDVTFTSFLDNAITSNGDVRIYDTVNGTVQYGRSLWGAENVNGGRINEAYARWPDIESLRAYYNVTSLPLFGSGSIDLKDLPVVDGYPTLGPLRRSGNLGIDNTKGKRTAKLGGTVYVTGNLVFQQAGNNDYVIDLNGKTILVEGSVTFPANSVAIKGSGCIIAVGDITFLPGTESSPGDFVLLLSLTGDVTLQPSSGTFYGSIAGASVQSDVTTKVDIVWQPLSQGGIDFPIAGYEIVKTATISTYEVSRH